MHKSRGQIACNQRTDGGLRGWRWELGASSTSILSQILGFLPFQHHQQEDVGRAASESHLPLPSVHPLDLRTAGGRLSLHLCTSVPCPVHQVRTLSIRISIWGTQAYKSVFGSVTFSSCPPPGPLTPAGNRACHYSQCTEQNSRGRMGLNWILSGN